MSWFARWTKRRCLNDTTAFILVPQPTTPALRIWSNLLQSAPVFQSIVSWFCELILLGLSRNILGSSVPRLLLFAFNYSYYLILYYPVLIRTYSNSLPSFSGRSFKYFLETISGHQRYSEDTEMLIRFKQLAAYKYFSMKSCNFPTKAVELPSFDSGLKDEGFATSQRYIPDIGTSRTERINIQFPRAWSVAT